MILREIEPGKVFLEKIVDAKGESANCGSFIQSGQSPISGEKFMITLVRTAHPTVIATGARSQ
jgi:hypothetical protein